MLKEDMLLHELKKIALKQLQASNEAYEIARNIIHSIEPLSDEQIEVQENVAKHIDSLINLGDTLSKNAKNTSDVIENSIRGKYK